MKSVDFSGHRVILDADDGLPEVRMILGDKRVKVLQFDKPLPAKLFERLNDEFFSQRPEVEFRAYGFYKDVCDLGFCRWMANVEHFRADCLQSAVGVKSVTKMPRLTLLGIGIHDLESFAFLEDLPLSMSSLTLLKTHSKQPDLAPLARFKQLKYLLLASQQRSIEAICGLEALETISLWGLSLKSVEFLNTLPALRELIFTLGGTRNLAGLAELKALRSLEICWVKKLMDLDAIAEMTGLEELVLDRLAHINSLPGLSKLAKLRKLRLNSLKSLVDVSELMNAPSLEVLIHTDAKTDPEDYLPVLRKGTLKNAGVWFGTKAKNETFERYRLAMGLMRGIAHP